IIDDEANDFNYFRGNVYETTIDNSNGGFVKVEDDVEFDTLNDGSLTYKSLPGKYKKEVKENNINYRDGDAMSSLNPRVEEEGEFSGNTMVDSLGNIIEIGTDSMGFAGGGATGGTTSEMYNAPVRSFYVDEKGRIILEKEIGRAHV